MLELRGLSPASSNLGPALLSGSGRQIPTIPGGGSGSTPHSPNHAGAQQVSPEIPRLHPGSSLDNPGVMGGAYSYWARELLILEHSTTYFRTRALHPTKKTPNPIGSESQMSNTWSLLSGPKVPCGPR